MYILVMKKDQNTYKQVILKLLTETVNKNITI